MLKTSPFEFGSLQMEKLRLICFWSCAWKRLDRKYTDTWNKTNRELSRINKPVVVEFPNAHRFNWVMWEKPLKVMLRRATAPAPPKNKTSNFWGGRFLFCFVFLIFNFWRHPVYFCFLTPNFWPVICFSFQKSKKTGINKETNKKQKQMLKNWTNTNKYIFKKQKT